MHVPRATPIIADIHDELIPAYRYFVDFQGQTDKIRTYVKLKLMLNITEYREGPC